MQDGQLLSARHAAQHGSQPLVGGRGGFQMFPGCFIGTVPGTTTMEEGWLFGWLDESRSRGRQEKMRVEIWPGQRRPSRLPLPLLRTDGDLSEGSFQT